MEIHNQLCEPNLSTLGIKTVIINTYHRHQQTQAQYKLPWEPDKVPFLSEGGVRGGLKWYEVRWCTSLFAKFFEWHVQQHDNGTWVFFLKLSSTGFPKNERISN